MTAATERIGDCGAASRSSIARSISSAASRSASRRVRASLRRRRATIGTRPGLGGAAGSGAALRAAGNTAVLGATGLPCLQLGGRAGRKGAFGFAASLARHLLIGHHNARLATGSTLYPGIHGLLGYHTRLLGSPAASTAAARTPRTGSSLHG